MATRIIELENNLWRAADQLRANSGLSSQEYSVPVLGLIFLRYADYKFSLAKKQIEATQTSSRRRAASDPRLIYQAQGVMHVPDEARFQRLTQLPEGEDIGAAVNDAMRAIEQENPALKDVLPKTYSRLPNSTLATLIKHLNFGELDIDEDVLGRIYEYFLGQFVAEHSQVPGTFPQSTRDKRPTKVPGTGRQTKHHEP